MAAPQLKRLVAGFPPLRSSHVGFVMDKVALGQVFPEYFGFPCQSSFHQISIGITTSKGTIGHMEDLRPQKLFSRLIILSYYYLCITILLLLLSFIIIWHTISVLLYSYYYLVLVLILIFDLSHIMYNDSWMK